MTRIFVGSLYQDVLGVSVVLTCFDLFRLFRVEEVVFLFVYVVVGVSKTLELL